MLLIKLIIIYDINGLVLASTILAFEQENIKRHKKWTWVELF